MRYQEDSWDCGPATAYHLATALDVKCRYRSLIKESGANAVDGTDEQGMIRALRSCGLLVKSFEHNDPDIAWKWLHGVLQSGRPVALCVDNWTHWVAVVGQLGSDRVTLVDSSNSRRNKKANGTHVLNKADLIHRWKNARISSSDGVKRLYAISTRRP